MSLLVALDPPIRDNSVSDRTQKIRQGTICVDSNNLTELLVTASAGKAGVDGRLLAAVYAELRAVAESCLRDERPGHTLQATALVHEAYLKLIDQRRVNWRNRGHFFSVAATAMRRILVDHARMRKRQKRGGADARTIALSDATPITPDREIDLIALDVCVGSGAV